MKKILAFVFALFLGLSALGCGSNDGDRITIYMPDGATAVSLAYMMKNYSEVDGKKVKYTVIAQQATVAQRAIADNAAMMVVPINQAINAYNNGAGYKLAAVMTHGNLYLVGNGITSLAELSGKTVGCFGENLIPGMVFRYILAEKGLTNSVNVTYYANGTMVGNMIMANTITLGVIAEPEATSTKETLNCTTYLNLQEEWEAVTGDEGYPQAALLVKDTLDDGFITEFLRLCALGDRVGDTPSWAEQNPAKAVQTIRSHIDAGAESNIASLNAEQIKGCNARVRTENLKAYVENYLSAMGEVHPADGFYYTL